MYRDRNMKGKITITFLLFLLSHSTEAGSPCPSLQSLLPCFCTNRDDSFTLVVCPGIQNASQLEEVTKSLKSLIVDHLLMLNIFPDGPDSMEDASNEVDPKTKVPVFGMFPKRWLSELRVRNLEIQNSKLNGYFLSEEALEGQSEFLTRVVVKNTNLRGHVCSSCGPASNTVAFSTKELRRTPLVNHVDFSHNQLEMIDGAAFPPNLKELKKIVLSHNHINRVYDNAFSNLHQLTHIDLSRNRLTTLTRKIFRTSDTALNIIDLSYNSIQSLPEDMFLSLNGLKEVKLSHNILETLPASTWTRVPALLEKIDVRGNFLVCNCSMNWIVRRMSKSTKLLGQCVGPKAAEFQDLKPNLPSIMSCS